MAYFENKLISDLRVEKESVMHIYLNNEVLQSYSSAISDDRKKAEIYERIGVGLVLNYGNIDPYVMLNGKSDILYSNGAKMKDAFIKATEQTFTKSRVADRELGIYYYGKAKAELVYSNGDSYGYCLKLETSDWDSIKDMQILEEKIWAGTILPVISYEREQKKGLLTILRTMLASKPLNKVQRFILAWRLTAA